MYETIEKHGNIFSHDWKDFAIHEQKARFEMGDLTADLVEAKWHEAYRRFYLRPERVMQRLLRKDTWRNAPARLKDAKRFFLGDQQSEATQPAAEGAYT